MWLFLLGLISEDTLKIELNSLWRPLIIPYSVAALNFSSKYVGGSWEQFTWQTFIEHILCLQLRTQHWNQQWAVGHALLWLTDCWQKQTINRPTKRCGVWLTPRAMKEAKSKRRRAEKTLQGRWSGKNCEEGIPAIGGVEERNFLSEEMQANSHWDSKRMTRSRKCKGGNWKSCAELYIMEAI